MEHQDELKQAYQVICEGWRLLRDNSEGRPAFFSVVAELESWQNKYKDSPSLFALASNIGVGIFAYLDKTSEKRGS